MAVDSQNNLKGNTKMDYFDFITEEEIDQINKYDCLYYEDTISLNDMKNLKLLDLYAYQEYLKKINNVNAEDKKGGVASE